MTAKTIKGGSWVYDSELGKLVPKDEYYRNKYAGSNVVVHGDLTRFVSPIDGTVIDDRGKLREHNKRHGVTDPRDYGTGWFEKKAHERQEATRSDSPKARQARLTTIYDAMNKYRR